jgi:hypothetical protein
VDVSVKLSDGAARPERLVEKVLAGSGTHIKTTRKALYREHRGILETPFGTPLKEEQEL